VLFLYCLAEYFEGYIQLRARRTVEKISKVIPEKARIIDTEEKKASTSAIPHRRGDFGAPGERIPLDGNVHRRLLPVDQALVTGESVPVPKRVNDASKQEPSTAQAS
jgi:Cd2+/Zn2+-exporting ATPase